MKLSRVRRLAIFSGVACLVVAGWATFDRFSGTNDSPDLSSSVRVASSRILRSGKERTNSKPRSLEELNGILRAAKEDWNQLKDTRYFFQSYADEIVSEFSLEEIRLLGFERTGHDFTSVIGFHYAIMRRWGELDDSGSLSHLVETINLNRDMRAKAYDLSLLNEEMAVLLKLRKIESYPGSAFDFPDHFYRKLLDEVIIGRARKNPLKFVSQIIKTNQERKEKGTFDSSIHIENSNTLLETFRKIAEQDPEKALALINDKEKLELISPRNQLLPSDKKEDGVNVTPLIKGYFSGLPDKSNWLNIYESLEPDFQDESLLPMLARWMDDDVNAALSWIHRKNLPASFFEDLDNHSPFVSSSELKSLESLPIDQHSLVIGHAAGIWFRRNPEEASPWISQNAQNLAPEFFEGSLLEVMNSPTGFLAILAKIKEVEHIQTRGRAILGFQKNMEFFTSMYPYSYEWREEHRVLELLKTIELDKNHREDLDKVIKQAERSIGIVSGTKGS